jgi:hypothetical protein
MGGSGSGRRTAKEPIDFADGLEPYERQWKESDPAWEAFQIYRDLGARRTLAKVAKKLGKSATLIEDWSATWSWRLRIEAWSRMIDREQRETEIAEVKAMRERQLKLATSIQGLGTIELQKRIDTASRGKTVTLNMDQVLRLITEGIKLERLNRGEPESIHESKVGVTVEDQRAALQKVADSAEVRAAMRKALQEAFKKEEE